MRAELGVLRPPSSILLGKDTIQALGQSVAPYGQRALICTDPFLATAPQTELAATVLRTSGLQVDILDGAVPELPRDSVEQAIEEARKLNPDCIVGLGGGSCLDLAKLVALGLSTEAPLERFYGELKVTAPTLPVVAIPTTAGTGSEVTPVAVLSDPALALKVGISSPHLIPRAAICDPALSMGAPSHVTAFAGIDALAHAVEAYCAVSRSGWAEIEGRVFVGRNVLSDVFALRATHLIFRSLRGAVEDDANARARMLEGSLCAGLAFATAGTALAHALQYPLGALTGTPHGLGVGLLLPFVMAFNAPACAQRLADIAATSGTDTGADGAIHAVRRLAQDVGLPASLREIGVRDADLPMLADQGLGIQRLIDNNPRQVNTEDAHQLLKHALDGQLPPTTTPQKGNL